MADAIISSSVQSILEGLGSLAFREIARAWGVESQVQKLKNTLSTINAVLMDAEEKQAHNRQVKDWLEKLKDAVYDAEVLLDEFGYEDLRRKVEIRGSTINKVRDFFSLSNPLAFRLKMAHKLEGIRDRLNEIAEDRTKFHFNEQVFGPRFVTLADRRQTHSFVSASDVIGRDGDREKIVKLLVGPSDRDDQPMSVLPIVGIGGLGKTALVQLVYNDTRIISAFDLRLWVCVSEDFDLRKLVEKIIRSAVGHDSDAALSNLDMDQLQIHLRSIINRVKFLLVLDDVWNEDSNQWVELKSLLTCGASGSKILVTTRSEKVAQIMGTFDAYHLEVLDKNACWSLFKKSSFREGEENKHPKLLEIGFNIVKKCAGVPLAAKSLGGMLFANTNERDWLFIQNNEIWKLPQKKDDILPILRLSYDLMPPSIKQCFTYCSRFPKDHGIGRDELITHKGLYGQLMGNKNWKMLEISTSMSCCLGPSSKT